jgi:hypothetical protein
MFKIKYLIGAALLCAAINCNAQDYTIRRDPIGTPFGPAYNVYNPAGQLQQTIKREPIGGPFDRGYTVHTMPLFNR